MRDELVDRERLVQVVDDRVSDEGVLAVDLAHDLLEVVPLALSSGGPPRGSGPRPGPSRASAAVKRAVGEQLGDRPDAVVDALRVVESVDAEQDALGVAQVACGSARARRTDLGQRARADELRRCRPRSGRRRRAPCGPRPRSRAYGAARARRAGVRAARSSAPRPAPGIRRDRRRGGRRAARGATAAARTARVAGTGCAGRTRSAGRDAAHAACRGTSCSW